MRQIRTILKAKTPSIFETLGVLELTVTRNA